MGIFRRHSGGKRIEQTDYDNAEIHENLLQNRKILGVMWDKCADFDGQIVEIKKTRFLIVVLKTLTSEKSISSTVVQIIQEAPSRITSVGTLADLLALPSLKLGYTFHDVNVALADGSVIVFVEGDSKCLIVNLTEIPTRSIEKSELEPSIMGPQEAFVEELHVNLALVRRRVKNPRLKLEIMRVGYLTGSIVVIAYIERVVKDSIVQEVKDRINRIDIDGIVDSNVVAEMISDAPRALFPTVQPTERPDRMVAALLQGRVGVLVDGSPIALLAPTTLLHLIQAPEDYYAPYQASIPIRMLRHVMFWISLLLPSLYIAVLMFHQEMLPTRLLLTLQKTHEGIPFPTIFEALLMETVFEALREAGIRLPKAVGQSVSIVGALVIGDAAVNAGLVSSGMVIIVAVTAIASFSIPTYSLSFATRILRFPIMILAAIFGLYGVACAVLVLLTHLVTIRSFGIPYMAPVAPSIPSDLRELVSRPAWWAMNHRPRVLEPESLNRGSKQRPSKRGKSR